MSTVLLVEDDAGVRDAMSLALRGLGHDVHVAGDGTTALQALAGAHGIDVVLLDVMMPGMDGFEVCRRLRRDQSLPIIMLTARGDAVDVVVGLECGADDYVVKPAEPRVLDARIKALLRRTIPQGHAQTLRLGDLTVDVDAVTAHRGGVAVGLTPMEIKLLECLWRNAGQVLSRQQLLDRVWDYDYTGDSRLVDAAIQRLRAKIEPDPGRPRFIHTVRGVGYRLDPA